MDLSAFLILDDGSVWPGMAFGAQPPQMGELTGTSMSFDGEVIFNTGMTGYHEILTDPSYAGQIVTMTAPHIGNYGCDSRWDEGSNPEGPVMAARGLVVRAVHDGPVPQGRISLPEYMKAQGVCGISGVDTRALTLKIRNQGSCNGVIVALAPGEKLEDLKQAATRYLATMPEMGGLNLADDSGSSQERVLQPEGHPHVALLDCGAKANILRCLERRGCKITVLPPRTSGQRVRELAPDALLFSNGPGDPGALDAQPALAEELLGRLPLWGICLGHQILARAAGAKTIKMRFGHHGVNHPVRDEKTGRVFVTSQNHGFAVDESTLPEGMTVRFRNANDGSIEGLEDKKNCLLCVQHHPEAAPGPADSEWIFDAFLSTLKEGPHASA
ncbi:MAG: glutamine-hydrolyzing carbamoyl-phosphate synthase small subunit [Spirochaetales bacterium]|nr:glutamine-hydrolyzing carbamoyl-phosphate synthase small subunit [Spirochaetales bacterium]